MSQQDSAESDLAMRLPYAPPRLTEYGDVRDLTASGSNAGMENFGSMFMNMA